jgi:hypothetical protein
LKNITINISKEIAIEAFNGGVCRVSLKEEQGRSKPKSIAQLMDIANRWAMVKIMLKQIHTHQMTRTHTQGTHWITNVDAIVEGSVRTKDHGYEEADSVEM